MINLFILVEELTTVLSSGYTEIRVYSDSTESGTFSTLVGSVALVSGRESYVFTDLNGTTSTWYKTSYYGAVPGESARSAARKGGTSESYATVLELRSQIQMSRETDDVELQLLLEAASRVIDAYTNRPMGYVAIPSATARIYPGSGSPVQFIDECISVSLVEVKTSPTDSTYETWTAGDYVLFSGDPEWPNFNDTPFDGLMVSGAGTQRIFYSGEWSLPRGFRPDYTPNRSLPMVRVTGRWGYAEVCPSLIKTVCIAQAARWYKRAQSAWADALSNAESFGTLTYRKPLDPDIQMMLVNARFMKPAIGRR